MRAPVHVGIQPLTLLVWRHVAVAVVLGWLSSWAPSISEASQTLEEARPLFVLNEWSEVASRAEPGFLAQPADVAVHASAIYVLDAGNYRVAVFSRDGRYQRTFGRPGQGPGEFSFGRRAVTAARIAVSATQVAVLDPTQRRIHVFALNGEFLHSVAFAESPRSLAYSEDNELFVLRAGYELAGIGELIVFNAAGEVVTERVAPLFETNSAAHLRANANAISVGQGKVIAQAYQFWPLVRITSLQEESVILRFGPEWWKIPPLAERSVESLRAFADVGERRFSGERWMYFRDLDYAVADDQWIALSEFATVHAFDSSGTLSRVVRLLPPSSSAESSYLLEGIGVDASAELICATDTLVSSVVACYDLSEDRGRAISEGPTKSAPR